MDLEQKRSEILETLNSWGTEGNGFPIDFGYRKYWLSFRSQEVMSKVSGPDELDGLADFSNGAITINKDLLGDVSKIPRIRETIYHEIIHVILDFLGYGEPEEGGPIAVINEELTIAISRGWMLFENLNPELHQLMMDMKLFEE